MSGKLYVIGVGPGDPELMTLKGARILSEVACVCVPKGKEEGTSLALSIVRKAVSLENKEIVECYFPMKKAGRPFQGQAFDGPWNETVSVLLDRLNRGTDTAFITLGDPTIFSTFFYLYDRLLEVNPGLQIEIVPGVSSINASAARAAISLALGDEKVAILPATYLDEVGSTLERFDTVVLMKVHRVFDKIIAILGGLGLVEKAVYISRAGMADETVCRDLTSLNPAELDYFSLIIVKK
jgi:precorrin-2/cobalt-factor-2 C20-methyltransferase